MSFGRRLALFFVLIALLPALAVVGMLLVVSEDSRRGKADVRLAAGLDTALALYEGQVADARKQSAPLAADGVLAIELGEKDRAGLQRFAVGASGKDGVVAVQVLAPDGDTLAAGGDAEAVAFADTEFTQAAKPAGTLRVSVTTASDYAAEVRRLTKRELVLRRNGEALASTVAPTDVSLDPGETVDLELEEGDFRAHLLLLDDAGGESLLLLGPPKEGGFLAIDHLAAALLVAFLLIGVSLAYMLARTLTGLHARVAEQAITDPLTGLWNRRGLQELLAREVDRANRFGHDLSLLIIDVDDFKAINDAHGHPLGDEVLRLIAKIMRRTTRSIDVGARYGGDELALVLLETGPAGAKVLAERLRTGVSEAEVPTKGADPLRVTVSVGTACVPESADTVDDLVELADQALLKAKRTGKNQSHVASPRPGGPPAQPSEPPRGTRRIGGRRRAARRGPS